MAENINGYQLKGELKNDNSGYSKWGFAVKNGHEFFIKQFLSPVYPLESSGLSEKQISQKRDICSRFENDKIRFYNELNKCRTGNIITVFDFFRYESKYYMVTEKVDAQPVPLNIISGLDIEKRILLAKIVLYCISSLHDHGIVHGDIKPDNILFKWTQKNVYTAKVIDFDSSFFEANPPGISDDFQGDMVYLAPESYLFIAEEDVKLTRKIDTFALGILIHQYFTGELPGFDRTKYDYAFESVLDDCPLVVNRSRIPAYLSEMIEKMLDKDPEKRPETREVFDVVMEKTRVSGQQIAYAPAGVYDGRLKTTMGRGKNVSHVPDASPASQMQTVGESSVINPQSGQIYPGGASPASDGSYFRRADDTL